MSNTPYLFKILKEKIINSYGFYCRNREDWEGARAIASLVGINCRDSWGDPVPVEEFEKRLNEQIQSSTQKVSNKE